MLLKMIHICLQQNFFLFNGKIYKQSLGTSMGTCFAPSFAGLYLGYWEEMVVRKMEAMHNVVMWTRYIDDVFVIWRGSRNDADEFVDALNINHFNLEFTSNFSSTSLEFLDLELTIKEGKLESSLFRKQTAGNSLLHARSCHPKSLVNSIPYGELLRAKRNCSTDEAYRREEACMTNRFLERGYSKQTIQKAKIKEDEKSRSSLLEPKKGKIEDGNKIRFITDFHSRVPEVKKSLKKFWGVLALEKDLAEHIEDTPRVTFRKAQSLKDTLCRTVETPPSKTLGVHSFFTCRNCKACRRSKNCKKCILAADTKPYYINKYTTCNTEFAIYALFCPCPKAYIGSTIHKAKKRVLEHLRAIKNGDQQYPMARHFQSHHQQNSDLVSFCVLDYIPLKIRGGNRIQELRRLESKLIIQYHTLAPSGHNCDEEMAVHLG